MKSVKNSTKVGLLQDLHIGVRGSEVFRKYIKSYLIDHALPYFHSQGITKILQGGDLMDSRVRLLAKDRGWMVKELIPKLKEYGITLFALSGNHDLGNKDDLELSWVDWIAAESDGCIVSCNKPQDLTVVGTTFSLIPWICKANYNEVLEYIENTDAEIAIMHAELAGFKMAKNSLCEKGSIDTKLLSKYKMVYSSHFHQESRSQNIHYLGMNYHTDWGSVESDPVKGLYTLDTMTQELHFHENPKEMTLFRVIQYDYPAIAALRQGKKWLDRNWLEEELGLKDSVVRVEVLNRENSSHYKKFIDNLRLVDCVNFNVLDLTERIETAEQEVSAKEFKLDTLGVLLDKVDSTENIRNKDVAKKLESVYNACKNNSNLV